MNSIFVHKDVKLQSNTSNKCILYKSISQKGVIEKGKGKKLIGHQTSRPQRCQCYKCTKGWRQHVGWKITSQFTIHHYIIYIMILLKDCEASFISFRGRYRVYSQILNINLFYCSDVSKTYYLLIFTSGATSTYCYYECISGLGILSLFVVIETNRRLEYITI